MYSVAPPRRCVQNTFFCISKIIGTQRCHGAKSSAIRLSVFVTVCVQSLIDLMTNDSLTTSQPAKKPVLMICSQSRVFPLHAKNITLKQ
jgi:hypothetical protein